MLPYRRYAPILKGLTMVLFVYVGTVMSVHIDWPKALRSAIAPALSFDPAYILTVVAVFGTTISPYVFFWQAAEEVEDMHLVRHPHALRDLKRGTRPTSDAHRRGYGHRHGVLHLHRGLHHAHGGGDAEREGDH